MNHIAQFARFVIELVSWRFLPLYIGAVAATVLLVWSGFDWLYLVFVLTYGSQLFLLSADIFGFLLPIVLVVIAAVTLVRSRSRVRRIYAAAVVYAILLGFSLSTIIKAFTGRTSPPHHHIGDVLVLIDTSNGFDFGFMNHHVIGGWPSSHTTIAFALAVSLALILPPRFYIRAGLFGIALFIGIGVTFGFHWLSEFVAGACLGTAIGLVVGKHYQKVLHTNNDS